MNIGLDHPSRIEIGEEPTDIEEGLPDAQLFVVRVVDDHFTNIIYFFSTRVAPVEYTTQQKKEIIVRVAAFSLIAGHLY